MILIFPSSYINAACFWLRIPGLTFRVSGFLSFYMGRLLFWYCPVCGPVYGPDELIDRVFSRGCFADKTKCAIPVSLFFKFVGICCGEEYKWGCVAVGMQSPE